MHQNKNQNKNKKHIPVLLEEVLKYLDPKPGDSYLDLTAGYGGHALAITERTGSLTSTVLVDRDKNAIDHLGKIFPKETVTLKQKDFLSAARELLIAHKQFDLILADLGVSSPHLNIGSRGFAIATDGPLDMRMDQNQELTAATIVNSYSTKQLVEILRRYGEEPKADRVANAIVAARPLISTKQLADVVKKVWPGRSKVHPATRTFQAIRIAVNDELNQLVDSIPIWLQLLSPGGRLAVISFHSLEDRIVKQAFKEVSGDRYDAQLVLLTKTAITPSPAELVHNPRSRSAKLRVAAKIKTKGN